MTQESRIADPGATTTVVGAKDDPHIDLPSGKGFTLAAADSIARRSYSNVILFAGTAKSGKTTLLSTLTLLFQRQQFGGFIFSGSATLVGFEERNYYVETESGLADPTMERTVLPEVLHLQVRRADSVGERSDLLLCDISGEAFREAKDSMEVCQHMDIIRRADTLVLLIDGAKLADPTSRHRAKNDPLTLLRSCLDGNVLKEETAVDILFTKWDLIQSDISKTEIEDLCNKLEQSIRQQFAGRVSRLRIGRIAAHPSQHTLPLGFGLEEPFKSWVAHRASRKPTPLTDVGGYTEYDRFLHRAEKASSEGKRD